MEAETSSETVISIYARPHSANQTTATLRSFKWEVLQHPPYSPDLAPSDFHLFGPLKHHLSGERFPDDDTVERAVRAWCRQQPKEFYAADFQGLVKRWDKCLNLYGDYVEKYMLFVCHYLHLILFNHNL
jgi:histone-lysine N-methyltransferase SETMAR